MARRNGCRRNDDAYLQKPFNAEELTIQVEKLIEQRRMLEERFEKILCGNIGNDNTLIDEDCKFINHLNTLIRDNMGDQEFNVEALAAKLYASESKLYRRIRALTGYSPHAYIQRLRMERAKELLITTPDPVGDIAMSCGFEDTSYFSRAFRNFYGCTPSQMRNNVP